MTKEKRRIEVEPYNDDWKFEFERIKEMLYSYIGDIIISIEHVGSTSVEGLAAKPIIDIDVVMDSYDVFPLIVHRLEKEGFEHVGDLGIKGREVFKRNIKDDFMNYHLYVCPKDGREYLQHIALRDYLRSNNNAKLEYGQLKQNLAKMYRYDIDNYIRHKTDFIIDILSKTIYKDFKK